MAARTMNLVQRIREEFEEAPGLSITMREAARFWGLDEPTCERVLAELLAAGFLAKGSTKRTDRHEWNASGNDAASQSVCL